MPPPEVMTGGRKYARKTDQLCVWSAGMRGVTARAGDSPVLGKFTVRKLRGGECGFRAGGAPGW